jgi:hypothetical protein
VSRTAALIVAGILAVACPPDASAQIPPIPPPGQPRPPRDTAQARDTIPVPPFRIPPPISPLGAFARSFLVPGWGQAILGRRVTGAFLVFWEGLTITMTLKASHQLDYLEELGDQERIDAKKQEVQDWAVLLVFNHLLAGSEAFVSAYLWDFPVELEQRALPAGRVGVGAAVRF